MFCKANDKNMGEPTFWDTLNLGEIALGQITLRTISTSNRYRNFDFRKSDEIRNNSSIHQQPRFTKSDYKKEIIAKGSCVPEKSQKKNPENVGYPLPPLGT